MLYMTVDYAVLQELKKDFAGVIPFLHDNLKRFLEVQIPREREKERTE